MKNNIHIVDLEIILKIFFPPELMVFFKDPQGGLSDTYKKYRSYNFGADTLEVQIPNSKSICFTDSPTKDYVLRLGTARKYKGYSSLTYGYINNPNGSIRWIYSLKNKTARFLNFYSQDSFRSKCIAVGFRALYFLGLRQFITAGTFTIYYKKKLELEKVVPNLRNTPHSLFMGTEGWGRTALVEVGERRRSSFFIKIPINEMGLKLLDKERSALNQFQGKFQTVTTPKICVNHSKKPFFITSNELSVGMKRSMTFLNIHAKSLVELFERTKNNSKINETKIFAILLKNIECLKNSNDHPQYKRIAAMLTAIYQDISDKDSCVFSLAHGDFTPWNMFVGNKGIYLYDWEMHQLRIPALFDLFHFHYQTAMFSKGKNDDVLKSVVESINGTDLAKVIEQNELDINFYYKCYLLCQISLRLPFIAEQESLSEDQKIVINQWESSLFSLCHNQSYESCRESFIDEFQYRLNRTSHVHLKFIIEDLKLIRYSSDLDVLVQKGDQKAIESFCIQHPLVQNFRIIRKSFMHTIGLYFKDGSFLSLDLIHAFKRKQLSFMDSDCLLKSRCINQFNVSQASYKYDIEYCYLFYTLNGARIPAKYSNYYLNPFVVLLPNKNKILSYINDKYGLKLDSFNELFNYSAYRRNALISSLEKSKMNSGINGIMHKWDYLIDCVKEFIFRRGILITLSGVDGVGKTTVLQKLKELLENKYRKEVILLRHRPGMFPILSSFIYGKKIADFRAGTLIPRKGKNRNFISSLLRFSYYYTDYIFGQVYVYFKYILRGKIVLYDRYYFDFIADPKRSNICLKKGIVQLLYFFISKPKLNYLLFADPNIILKRKQELSIKDINDLTKGYKTLFGWLKKKYPASSYCMIENKNLNNTLQKIEKEFLKIV